MIRIELTDQQAAVLSEELRQTIANLGMEIAGTERLAFRDQIKERRRLLQEVVKEMERAHPQEAA